MNIFQFEIWSMFYIFESTVRVTLPVRSVSKGASFAFKPNAFQLC